MDKLEIIVDIKTVVKNYKFWGVFCKANMEGIY